MTTTRTPNGIMAKTSLKIYNSITKEKEVLKVENSMLKWYTCGPTVYDSAHLGHARSYVQLDSIRKTLERYFNYQITYIMNITDIDDKIIIKAREVAKSLKEAPGTQIEQLTQQFKQWAISAKLDTEEQELIHYAVKEVSRKYEEEFFEDMHALGVARPTYTTRVSDYIEEIIQFITKIEEEGFAYHAQGSVYFDTKAYSQKKQYPLMCPVQSSSQQDLLEEGEGKLGSEGKRNKEDFVLWKASKSNEPAWPSKWGPGRPGWHIECSAMAANIANGRIDLHSGGVDLTFPHHDNEIAQSEGAGIEDWVGHFLHTGHLHIDGRKMSKSLKNFVQVKEMLKSGTARELRMMFLLQSYRGPMTYGDEALERAKTVERRIFRYISLYPEDESETTTAPFTAKEHEILKRFDELVLEIDSALKDDFNFPRALGLVQDLITEASATTSRQINQQIAKYISRIMHAMGLEAVTQSADSAVQTELISVISNFRNTVRQLTKTSAEKKAYFMACDTLRSDLAALNIIVEDAANPQEGSSIRKQC
ncbi:cysteinyl-tRNA synthetase [Nematocida homosporus]|uniref:cysteinyl-tRNA synthetase n=1 Tax=Nematocida homosporus TaxID=1912981 RepID=UPI00221FE2B6|nr:cysteinyl-tRNA synthetase [Nematocida homosporus]KAI5184802.1 cysteinyl-tRNA synthetase [Nematocida homosporus]